MYETSAGNAPLVEAFADNAPLAVRELADRRRGAAPLDRERLHPSAERGPPGDDLRVHGGVLPQPLHARHGGPRRPRQPAAPGGVRSQSQPVLRRGRPCVVARRGDRVLQPHRRVPGRLPAVVGASPGDRRRGPVRRRRLAGAAAPAGEPLGAPGRRRQQPALADLHGRPDGTPLGARARGVRRGLVEPPVLQRRRAPRRADRARPRHRPRRVPLGPRRRPRARHGAGGPAVVDAARALLRGGPPGGELPAGLAARRGAGRARRRVRARAAVPRRRERRAGPTGRPAGRERAGAAARELVPLPAVRGQRRAPRGHRRLRLAHAQPARPARLAGLSSPALAAPRGARGRRRGPLHRPQPRHRLRRRLAARRQSLLPPRPRRGERLVGHARRRTRRVDRARPRGQWQDGRTPTSTCRCGASCTAHRGACRAGAARGAGARGPGGRRARRPP